MSKSANRRVFRRRSDPDHAPLEPKRRWWRRRKSDVEQAGVGESSTLSPTSVNHAASDGPRRFDGRSTKRQRVQRIRLREQRARGNSVREWLQEQLSANERRRAQRRKDAKDQPGVSRGVDRVPDRLRVRHTTTLTGPSTALPNPVETREVRGRWVRAPYRNPDRIYRLAKSGRLRAELRDQVDVEQTGARS